jgi:hypothetical protein
MPPARAPVPHARPAANWPPPSPNRRGLPPLAGGPVGSPPRPAAWLAPAGQCQDPAANPLNRGKGRSARRAPGDTVAPPQSPSKLCAATPASLGAYHALRPGRRPGECVPLQTLRRMARSRLTIYSPTSLGGQSPTHPLKWTEICEKSLLTMGVVQALDLTIVKDPARP